MRKTLALTSLFILGLAAPAAAAPTSWPGSAQPGDKQCVKMWENTDFNGDKEAECGRWDAPWWRADLDVWDPNFGSSGLGEVENFNDEMSSLVVLNKTTGADLSGVCVVFFMHADFDVSWQWPQMAAIWVQGKPLGAAYRYQKYRSLHGSPAYLFPHDKMSSMKMWDKDNGIDTKAKCLLRDDFGLSDLQTGSGTKW